MSICLAVPGIACSLATAAAQKPSFTIDAALSAPFPSGLTAAPTGGRVAWIFNAKGSRNIWVGEPGADGSFSSRQLTGYTGDLGIEIGTLAWSFDGQTIAFERGGEPNPRDLPLGSAPAQIWAIALGDTAPRLIGDGSSPRMAPGANVLAYVARNSIVLAPLGGGKPQIVVRDLGRDGSLAWSPDGGRLAFVSSRPDHNVVGVYDLARKSITWLAPSVDRDADPIWSPDGSRIAFVRVPAASPGPFSSTRASEPWWIWVADPSTGKGHEIWHAHAGAGSRFYRLEGEPAFAWGADDRIVFPWEGTGWVHLYSIAASGDGAPTLLTPGDFEVFSADLSPDRRHIVYSSNQDDLDHRHIWEVPVAGGAPVALTTGPTIADLPVFTSDGHAVAILHADAKSPMRPAVLVESGGRFAAARDLAPQALPEEYPGAIFVVPQQVIFRSPDGMMIHGQLFLPPNDARGTRHPALVFFHGGPYRQMLLGANPMDAYSYMYAENQYFASRGYVVLSVNYRGGTGYGLNFRVPPKFGPDGASEFNDVLGGANFLKARTDVDAKRIGVWGGSYGGYLTALALARASDVFAAGVDYAGVHDWSGLLKAYAAAGAKSASDSIAWASSPLSSIARWRSPVLVMQADDDHNVPFSQSVMLTAALREHKIPYELIVIPNEIHDLLLHRSWLRYFQAQSEFLDEHLRR